MHTNDQIQHVKEDPSKAVPQAKDALGKALDKMFVPIHIVHQENGDVVDHADAQHSNGVDSNYVELHSDDVAKSHDDIEVAKSHDDIDNSADAVIQNFVADFVTELKLRSESRQDRIIYSIFCSTPINAGEFEIWQTKDSLVSFLDGGADCSLCNNIIYDSLPVDSCSVMTIDTTTDSWEYTQLGVIIA
eukprot:790980_1